jgi:hypothetical protein
MLSGMLLAQHLLGASHYGIFKSAMKNLLEHARRDGKFFSPKKIVISPCTAFPEEDYCRQLAPTICLRDRPGAPALAQRTLDGRPWI